MVSISENNIISINAGDYFKAPLFINGSDEFEPVRYILQGNDKVCFSIIEPNQPFECGIVRKEYTVDNLNSFGDVIVELVESDTVDVLPGTYYYEVKLLIVRDDKEYSTTVVPRRKFIIM